MDKILVSVLVNRDSGKSYTWNTLFDATNDVALGCVASLSQPDNKSFELTKVPDNTL